MLTPTIDDPNRAAVLAEMKKNPKAFGEDVPTADTEPVRNLSGSGLVEDAPVPKTLTLDKSKGK